MMFTITFQYMTPTLHCPAFSQTNPKVPKSPRRWMPWRRKTYHAQIPAPCLQTITNNFNNSLFYLLTISFTLYLFFVTCNSSYKDGNFFQGLKSNPQGFGALCQGCWAPCPGSREAKRMFWVLTFPWEEVWECGCPWDGLWGFWGHLQRRKTSPNK